MKPTPLQGRLLRLLADVPAYVDASRGRAWVEADSQQMPGWKDYKDHNAGYQEAWDRYKAAQAAADLQRLRRATVEVCVRAGWLAEGQHGPNTWNRGWFLTDAGRDVAAMLGPEDLVDRPRGPGAVAPPVEVMLDALKDRWHGLMGWVWFVEIGFIRHGMTRGRRLDALAVNRWGGKYGFERMAFEIKRSRGDFLGELKDPAKRLDGRSLVDRFWYVTPEGMVRPEEVPGDSGLVWVDEEGRATIKRKAPKLAEAPTDRRLVGAILTYMVDRPGQQEWRKAMKELGE